MPLWAWALVALVASYVLTAVIVKPANQSPAALSDFDFPQAEEGTPQAVIFGDCWLDGWMVLWYGNYRTSKVKAGGKK